MEPAFLSTTTRILWRLLESQNIDFVSLGRECGLDPALADNPRATYPVDQVAKAWTKASLLMDLPSIGLESANFYRATDLHALGYAFLASSSLRTALDRVIRYSAIINSYVFQIKEDKQGISLCSPPLLGLATPASAILEDSRFSLILALCRRASMEGLNPIAVAFVHPEPEDTAPYYGFFRCPVTFGANESRVSFSLQQAERPFTAANHDLALANDSVMTDFVRSLQMDNLVLKVKSTIIEELPSGEPAAETIAKSLYMSTRSLQRKLADEGTTYTKLLSDVRFRLAEKYLVDDSYSITEISYLLGFADTSVFSRAFKRWSGHPPGYFRK